MRATIAIAIFLAPALAAGQQDTKVHSYLETATGSGYGTVVDGLAISTARWTGWIATAGVSDVAFDVTLVDADDSVTTITMVCETSTDNTVANDAGHDYCSRSTATGVSTYTCPHTWTLTTPTATSRWKWSAEDVDAPFLNCKFDATGTPGAADLVTVVARGVTP